MLPDLSRMRVKEEPSASESAKALKEPANLPPAPTRDGDERYFYILHRPGDSSTPQPEMVRDFVSSGGVGATRRYKYARDDDEKGIAGFVIDYIEYSLQRSFRLQSANEKGSMSWYYLDTQHRTDILQLASEDELVFRVPEAWLKQNALSCLEWLAKGKKTIDDDYALLPWAFLTTLIVPLSYRITDSSPLDNEEARRIKTRDVGRIIYDAHMKEDPTSRDEDRYNQPPPPPPQPPFRERINPFA